jgi:hypothetical protein
VQHLILVSTLIYWALIVYVVLRWTESAQESISDHVKHGFRRNLYVSVTATSVSLLATFLAFWFIPEFELPAIAYLFVACAAIAEIATTFIPRINNSIKIHDNLANTAGISILLFNCLILLSHQVATELAYVVGLFSFAMLILGFRLRVYGRRHYLSQQIAYYGLFNLGILLVTYFG